MTRPADGLGPTIRGEWESTSSIAPSPRSRSQLLRRGGANQMQRPAPGALLAMLSDRAGELRDYARKSGGDLLDLMIAAVYEQAVCGCAGSAGT